MSETGIPNHIQTWRKLRKMSGEALALALDPPTSKGTISNYENGTRAFSLSRLLELAKALQTTPGALLDGPPKVPTQDELADMLASAQNEVGIDGLTIGGYPSAVASGLRARLLQYSNVRASDVESASEPETPPVEAARPRPPTKKSVRAGSRTP